jgi:hypothetical protein
VAARSDSRSLRGLVPQVSKSHGERGFSVIELVVALLISVEILIGAAVAFDVHNRIAHVQLQVTDMQQSQRIAQYDLVRAIRTAGRGGLPLDLAPAAIFDPNPPSPEAVQLRGLALEVRNNVSGDETYIARGDNTSPKALSGTDILTVRGCIATSLYSADLDGLQPSTADATVHQRTLTLKSRDSSVETEIHQSLDGLKAELDNYTAGGGYFGQMIIVGSEGRTVYGVGDITAVDEGSYPDQLVLTLSTTNIDATSPTPRSPLNPLDDDAIAGHRSFPDSLSSVLACYLEEYRYYVREEYQIPGDATSGLHPRLSRARFEPGTELPYLNDTSNLKLDLADEIIDLQVALGLDTDYCEGCSIGTSAGALDDDTDVLGPDDVIWEDTAAGGSPGADDWLYNSSSDLPLTDTLYVTHGGTFQPGAAVKLYFVRVTTVARTTKGDPTYIAPNFSNALDSGSDSIEDHNYNSGSAAVFKAGDNRKFRHRVLTTVVAPRNVS